VIIAAIGRDRAGPTRDLFDDYCRRTLWPVRLVEIVPRSGPRERRLREEGDRLLQAVPPGAALVALDEAGHQLDSAGFAQRIVGWQEQGHSALAFAIGGPDGLAQSVLDRAETAIAFGRMTWPHRLVRVMLVEQLYRVSTILSGHPYHRA
jgi:23S rRNA (pseudouridine1915-N3)-methyltransferase